MEDSPFVGNAAVLDFNFHVSHYDTARRAMHAEGLIQPPDVLVAAGWPVDAYTRLNEIAAHAKAADAPLTMRAWQSTGGQGRSLWDRRQSVAGSAWATTRRGRTWATFIPWLALSACATAAVDEDDADLLVHAFSSQRYAAPGDVVGDPLRLITGEWAPVGRLATAAYAAGLSADQAAVQHATEPLAESTLWAMAALRGWRIPEGLLDLLTLQQPVDMDATHPNS